MKVEWRFCKVAERDHERNQRWYAHTFHYGETICLCRAFWDLPATYRDAIILHEVGHLLVGPRGSERDATRAAEKFFGMRIEYVDSPYGKRLERLRYRER